MADTIASPLLQSLLDRLDSFCLSFGDGDEMLTRLRSVVASVKEVAAVAEQRFEMEAETKRWLTEVKRLAGELDYLLDDYEQQVRKVQNLKLWAGIWTGTRIGVAICSRKILSMNALEDGVTRELVGKIFLVVLDNLWHEEMDLAITLRRWFSVGSPGSAVIVTTRSTAAADSVGDMPVYYLQPLRDADCLDMFWKVALLPREEMEENQNTKLSEIGKAVVANCRGLPLAVKILGALLPYNGEMDDWLSVASLALLELQNSTTCSVLRIASFEHFSAELRHCSLICESEPSPALRYLSKLGDLQTLLLLSGIGKLRLLKKLPTFVLGKRSDCAKLNDLSGLDLTERLEIKNLENVTKEADAQDAKLYEKVSLHSLGLSWGDNDCMNAQMSAKILENLSPPQNLRDFCLKGYRGSSFPSWMNQSLLNLLKISLINCSCQELPPLGQLPSLKVLYLKGMSEVRTIGHEFYGNGAVRGFPCLEQLEIYDMHNLEGWKSIQMEKTEIFTVVGGSSGPLSQEAFPCLDKLVVKGCRRLTALPVIPNLRSLALCDSNGMLLCSVVHLPSLSSLVIEKLKELESLTDYSKSFCSIEKLTLYDCDHLDYLFERNQVFSALKYLSILYCDGLMSLPLGLRLLTSLQRFDVMECGHLTDISILQTLSSLQELIIEGCPMLLSLPSGIHNLTNLRRLVIKGCPALQKDTWI
ncbi:hypothetical protein SCA6_016792 [Theobroma cacao]